MSPGKLLSLRLKNGNFVKTQTFVLNLCNQCLLLSCPPECGERLDHGSLRELRFQLHKWKSKSQDGRGFH